MESRYICRHGRPPGTQEARDPHRDPRRGDAAVRRAGLRGDDDGPDRRGRRRLARDGLHLLPDQGGDRLRRRRPPPSTASPPGWQAEHEGTIAVVRGVARRARRLVRARARAAAAARARGAGRRRPPAAALRRGRARHRRARSRPSCGHELAARLAAASLVAAPARRGGDRGRADGAGGAGAQRGRDQRAARRRGAPSPRPGSPRSVECRRATVRPAARPRGCGAATMDAPGVHRPSRPGRPRARRPRAGRRDRDRSRRAARPARRADRRHPLTRRMDYPAVAT